jgi:hypothetical protein
MATAAEIILPDLQSCVLCEDVRCEFNGMQTLVGVINVIPTPTLPINYLRLCIWTRWCSGAGKFRQKSRIVGVDEQQVIAQAEVEFGLKEMEGHATNVHYFGGGPVPTIRIASCRNLPGRPVAAALSVARYSSQEVISFLRAKIFHRTHLINRNWVR